MVQQIKMNPQNTQLADLQAQVTKLSSDVSSLTANFYKNNFSSSQNFTKAIVFQKSLRVPIYDSAPSICAVGELICVAGKLYICTVADTTFTLVGTQS